MINPAPIDKKTELTMQYHYLKVKLMREKQYFRYRPDLVERMNAVHNQLVDLQTNPREVSV